MKRVLQHLQRRVARPLLPQTKKEMPSLPVEIWLIIIQMALRPSLVVDIEFEPFEIEQAREYLDIWYESNEEPAQKMVSRSKDTLRRVCRTWEALVDRIDTSTDKWAWERGEGIPLTDPTERNQCHYLRFVGYMSRYRLPVCALIQSYRDWQPEDEPTSTPMINSKELTSSSEHIKVLSLHVSQYSPSKDVLRTIGARMALTTLRVRTKSVDILQTSLEIPTLINLFMTIPAYIRQDWNKDPSRFRWSFPSLRSLWWENHYPDPAGKGHPLFLDILRDHFDFIRSLRMCPAAKEVLGEGSDLCWIKMPNLQAFTTKFGQIWDTYDDGDISRTTPRSKSVRHLVALDGVEKSPQVIVDKLRRYIRICKNLETIYLSGYFPEHFEKKGRYYDNWWYVGAIQRLQKLCKGKYIKIKYKKDDEFVDISPRRKGTFDG